MRAIAIVFVGWLMPQLWIEWSMQIESDDLRIDYTVRNHGPQRVLLFDQLARGAVQPEQIMVAHRSDHATADAPAALRFLRGYDIQLPNDGPMSPTGRELAPGGQVTGVARILLPVRSWWSAGREAACCSAVLEIGYSDDPRAELHATDSGLRQLRDMRRSKLLRGGVRQIPREAMNRAPVPNEHRAWRGGPWVKSPR